jgi:hypothetical protein
MVLAKSILGKQLGEHARYLILGADGKDLDQPEPYRQW